jgi:hypothetical protein
MAEINPSPLPALENEKVSINEVCETWNSTLRNLDVWHKGLIAAKFNRTTKDGPGPGSQNTDTSGRLGQNDGLSEEDIVNRLDVIRLSIKGSPTIKGLADGLRN